MRRSLVLAVALAFASVGRLCAHEPETLPTAEPLPIQPVPAKAETSGEEIDHLLKAAQHLESAGLKDEAQRMRSMARERALRDNVVARKEEELECLLAQVEELRNLTGQPRTVMIRVTAIEFSRAALGEKGAVFDAIFGRRAPEKANDEPPRDTMPQETGIPGYRFDSIPASAASRATHSSYSIVEGNPLAHPLVRELQEKGLLKCLAEPTVKTASGRPVSFLSGGRFPVPVRSTSADGGLQTNWMPFGVQLQARATVMAGGRVRIRAKFEISEKDLLHVVYVEGAPVPGLSTRGINTETELRFGQTAVLGGLASRRTNACDANDSFVARIVSQFATKADGAKRNAAPLETDDLREMIFLITAESADADRPASRLVELIPTEIDPDDLRRLISPPGVPDDVQYFPASPIPRKGTLR